MLKRIRFLALYGLSWILFFQLFRIIFFAYHFKKSIDLGGYLLVQSALHGLRMDISFAGYILMIPTLLMALSSIKWKWYQNFLRWYSAIVAFLMVLLTVFDLELFRAWGFRIDASSLIYLKTPKEAFASMGAAPVFPLLIIFVLLLILVTKSLFTIQNRTIPYFSGSSPIFTALLFVFLAATLIIPIRGGFNLAPMNESAVYFSNKSFANYAAVNVPWNYSRSLLHDGFNKRNPFNYFPDEKAKATVTSLYYKGKEHEQLIDTVHAPVNVIIIIWESFTAKVVEKLNGVPGITPQFNALTKEGILFTNMYASGNRSDKGMVAVLSGYPAQPTTSIIKIPNKTVSLPSLPREFRDFGYNTSFYYGGETEFANMKTYFIQQGFNTIVDKNAFDEADMNSKWGAHDHVVLNKFLSDIDQKKQPFFTTLFTLSSHEPFEVPVKTVIPGNDPEHLFLNALHYSDASIGEFIRKAKTKSWWNNTLVVILADHGHPLPEKPASKPNEFHIPMLWLGGVLKKKNIQVDTLCSQTDLAATLLNQLNLPSNTFSWSNDIFMKKRTPFAYFAFMNGLGWIRPNGFIIRDNIGGNITEKSGNLKPVEVDYGKSYLQASFGDYLKR
ncbi:LTA synthase family protein [Dyadobacter subterraneus]|uniref:Sulfatase-like hydrolase/transferase n=1 Tax=Dyadobacter subterraneus TaxID=2773304 RepID=A0ABR9WAR3_9BACT|nr:alkaline phosphatase family protein [Dyadobacter subterraneus]MBE9462570.1 sulfatase-like hydrolase/transferase [Dyadobacter subterraneus]